MSPRATVAVVAGVVLLLATLCGVAGMGIFLFRVYSADDTLELVLPEPAKPVATPRFTLRLIDQDRVAINGEEVAMADLETRLTQHVRSQNLKPSECILLVQAPNNVKTGVVQGLIRRCQLAGFEQFELRVVSE